MQSLSFYYWSLILTCITSVLSLRNLLKRLLYSEVIFEKDLTGEWDSQAHLSTSNFEARPSPCPSLLHSHEENSPHDVFCCWGQGSAQLKNEHPNNAVTAKGV